MPPARTVVLTDEAGAALGTADLVAAHTGKGLLHRAFSVYVFRSGRSEVLMQRRAAAKMLWPLVWSNTCCSHPLEGETPAAAGERRLREELGFSVPLSVHSSFVYRAEDDGRGVEHEHVAILVGDALGEVALRPNPEEVAEAKWIGVTELRADMERDPERYTPWFHVGLGKLLTSH